MPTCVDVGRTLRGNVDGVAASRAKQAAITKTCVAEKWRADAIDCVVRELQIYVCRGKLDQQQHDRFREAVCRYQEQYPDETRDVDSCEPSKSAPLYERLGGKDAVKAIVEDWLANALADTRTSPYFVNVDVVVLRQRLFDQMCMLGGGPCSYGGKEMGRAHAGMGITASTFDAFLQQLRKALDKHAIRPDEQKELLAKYRKLKPAIVRR